MAQAPEFPGSAHDIREHLDRLQQTVDERSRNVAKAKAKNDQAEIHLQRSRATLVIHREKEPRLQMDITEAGYELEDTMWRVITAEHDHKTATAAEENYRDWALSECTLHNCNSQLVRLPVEILTTIFQCLSWTPRTVSSYASISTYIRQVQVQAACLWTEINLSWHGMSAALFAKRARGLPITLTLYDADPDDCLLRGVEDHPQELATWLYERAHEVIFDIPHAPPVQAECSVDVPLLLLSTVMNTSLNRLELHSQLAPFLDVSSVLSEQSFAHLTALVLHSVCVTGTPSAMPQLDALGVRDIHCSRSTLSTLLTSSDRLRFIGIEGPLNHPFDGRRVVAPHVPATLPGLGTMNRHSLRELILADIGVLAIHDILHQLPSPSHVFDVVAIPTNTNWPYEDGEDTTDTQREATLLCVVHARYCLAKISGELSCVNEDGVLTVRRGPRGAHVTETFRYAYTQRRFTLQMATKLSTLHEILPHDEAIVRKIEFDQPMVANIVNVLVSLEQVINMSKVLEIQVICRGDNEEEHGDEIQDWLQKREHAVKWAPRTLWVTEDWNVRRTRILHNILHD
jgi:hypothetical protein